MLFVFEQLGYPGIWMKDMQFSIDVLWLDQTNTIVDIREVVSPETYPQVFAPKAKSIFVIELPADSYKNTKLKLAIRYRSKVTTFSGARACFLSRLYILYSLLFYLDVNFLSVIHSFEK